MRILLVEDDARMSALVRRGLTEEGHAVHVARTGGAAIDAARRDAWDVIVLDVLLPDISGVDVVQRLRASGHRTPMLMLTARDGAADIVQALDAGADDYLTKPFSFSVLLARLRALSRRAVNKADAHESAETTPRRANAATDPKRFEVGDLVLDHATRSVTRAGDVLALTRTEFNLLECLLERHGRVVTRRQLIEHVWGFEREVEGNTLDAFIRLLRQKVDAAGRMPLIHTVRGVGYMITTRAEAREL